MLHVAVLSLSPVLLWMVSTEQQFIHAERKAFAICEKEGPSHAGENGKIQGRLDP
jgi:hypothetical protein